MYFIKAAFCSFFQLFKPLISIKLAHFIVAYNPFIRQSTIKSENWTKMSDGKIAQKPFRKIQGLRIVFIKVKVTIFKSKEVLKYVILEVLRIIGGCPTCCSSIANIICVLAPAHVKSASQVMQTEKRIHLTHINTIVFANIVSSCPGSLSFLQICCVCLLYYSQIQIFHHHVQKHSVTYLTTPMIYKTFTIPFHIVLLFMRND